jgi:hypothetical protein
METGFPQADARDDFDRARRRANWARLAAWLRGRPVARLQVLGEVAVGRPRGALVPIGQIVGSVEPSVHFDALFRPTSQLPRFRFERIAVARAFGQREVWAEVTEVRAARSCLC